MRNGSLAQTLSAGIDQANLMALARPVDADKPFNLFRHARPSSRITHIRAAATSVNPCTGARSATSHGTSVAADLPGCGPFQVLKTQDSRATPGRPARFGQS